MYKRPKPRIAGPRPDRRYARRHRDSRSINCSSYSKLPPRRLIAPNLRSHRPVSKQLLAHAAAINRSRIRAGDGEQRTHVELQCTVLGEHALQGAHSIGSRDEPPAPLWLKIALYPNEVQTEVLFEEFGDEGLWPAHGIGQGNVSGTWTANLKWASAEDIGAERRVALAPSGICTVRAERGRHGHEMGMRWDGCSASRRWTEACRGHQQQIQRYK
ncbi:hypothetical protein FB451DRAFT_1191156 [Mycena latifolia]|nr:hypothetical protein FB451DRAFT_1191156 [Mycena latifolia]